MTETETAKTNQESAPITQAGAMTAKPPEKPADKQEDQGAQKMAPESRQLPAEAADHEQMLAGPKGSTAAAYETAHKAEVEALGLKVAGDGPPPVPSGDMLTDVEEISTHPARADAEAKASV